ncbi:MAG: hypothetical protein V9E98_10630 [Candidatus Nanopelagicales bacterium]
MRSSSGARSSLATAIGRGIATGRGHYAVVGGASAITGLAMVVVPLALLRLGQPALTSFLVGAVVAWIAGLVVVAFAGLTRRLRLFDTIAGDPVTGGTALLVAGNLLMTASVLAVPSVLRWHVGTIGAELTADVQLVVSLSRLASTVVLGLVPIMIATMSGMQGRRHVSTQTWLAVATGFAALSVATLTLIGAPAVSWLTGRVDRHGPRAHRRRDGARDPAGAGGRPDGAGDAAPAVRRHHPRVAGVSGGPDRGRNCRFPRRMS